ncbi:MAG: hypothetical protein WB609_02210 [Candidatus Cybelea sp.]
MSTATLVGAFAACAGEQLQPAGSAFDRRPDGRPAPQPILTPQPTPIPPAAWQHSLFVDDDAACNTQPLQPCPIRLFKDGTWAPNVTISTTGFVTGLWSDQKYLYASKLFLGWNSQLDEYRPNNPTPSFTYSNGWTEVGRITTQTLSNVHYVFVSATYTPGGTLNFVQELKRDTNTVLATCYPGNGSENVTGIAVDISGRVFVAYNDQQFIGHIVEYVGGFAACNAIALPISFLGFVGQMVMDNVGRLLICDSRGATVDVINPPYNSISGTLGSGMVFPQSVSINLTNTLVFVGDDSPPVERILQYPSGTLIHTLGAADGLHDADDAVEWANDGF